MEEEIFPTQCEICDAHKTELGLLKELEETVRENFSGWDKDKQEDLIINWFIQTKMDERMKYIETSKQKTTQRIQQYKKLNIASFKKEG